MKHPRVTVLMPVYNGQEYLAEAIESILNQSFNDFEFLIIDDGSKDESKSIIEAYAKKDSRINLISRANKGLTDTLNEGISKARGEYIARMDADDISLPRRLELEINYLDSHPRVGLVGSLYDVVDEKARYLVDAKTFTHPDDLKLCLVTCNPYGHGTVIMRKDTLEKAGGYDKRGGLAEDYDLWIRISQIADVANVEQMLYKWRKLPGSVTNANQGLQLQHTFALRDKAFEHFLKNKRSYHILSIHPSGAGYGRRKAVVYRDLAYLYLTKGKRWGAMKMLILAMVFKPRVKRTYFYFLIVFYRPWLSKWPYELQ